MIDLIMQVRREVLEGKEISYENAVLFTKISAIEIPYLAAAANEIRVKMTGDRAEACALSNIKSGNCSEDCKFCAQSGHYRTDSPVYPQISADEIVRQAKAAEQIGATEFCLVSSGWGVTREDEFKTILEAVRRISRETRLYADCSLGFLNAGQMRQLKEAGLYRNNHNLETSSDFFEKVCTSHKHQDRVNHVNQARSHGIHPCSGGILGMGETPEDRIKLAFELKAAGADCVPINILNPREGTPLGNVQTLEPLEIIRYIAIYRFILPKSTIKIAGGREVNLRDLQAMALMAGGNGIIIGNYLTTMGRNPAQDMQMLKDLGFKTNNGSGPASSAPAVKEKQSCCFS